MEMVACAPAAAAAAAAASASAVSAPSDMAFCIAATAGARASTIVFSPSRAAPSFCTPASAASRHEASSGRPASTASPRVLPACRSAIPYSGPDAPPTFEMRVDPARMSTEPGVGVTAWSSATAMALNPRARLIPWSASPIAASSWVRWLRWDSMTVPASASQARKNAASITAPRGSVRRPLLSAAAGLSFLPSPPQGWRVYRRVPKVGERVRELAGRHREALHLQAGDVVADQVPGDPGALPADVLVQFVVEHVQLDGRRAAHAVDHDQDVAG